MKALRKNLHLYLLALLLLTTFVVWSAVVRGAVGGGELVVAFLDVGQGDSVFIETPSGNQVLVDSGPNKSVVRALSGLMPFYDRSIDMILATHPDKDHIGGFPEVLAQYDIDIVMRSGAKNSTGVFNSFNEMVEMEQGVVELLARRGQVIDLGDGVLLTILFPDRDVSGASVNDASIIARLTYGETSFLLTGDAPQKVEKYLVTLDDGALKSDVLKIGHHGSKTSSAELFLGFVSPSYAVISAGRDNRRVRITALDHTTMSVAKVGDRLIFLYPHIHPKHLSPLLFQI